VLFIDFVVFTVLTALFVRNSWTANTLYTILQHRYHIMKHRLFGMSQPRYKSVLDDDHGAQTIVSSALDEGEGDDEDDGEVYDEMGGIDELGLGISANSPENFHPPGYVEDRPTSSHSSVQVIGLTKTFQKKGKTGYKREFALNGCCLELRHGELTALMGINGAGKTTLLSILTGSMKANSGKASVLGFNALAPEGLLDVRQSIGICPQEDALFEGFTAREMMYFYARLKGMQEEKCDREVEHMLTEMGLTSSGGKSSDQSRKAADVQVENLSGGQKRRVSIGVALIGNSKFVVLDEPTSAMDPVGKHQVCSRERTNIVLSSSSYSVFLFLSFFAPFCSFFSFFFFHQLVKLRNVLCVA
jgi:ABC-type Na+ transport system ATPase subunit NatA